MLTSTDQASRVLVSARCWHWMAGHISFASVTSRTPGGNRCQL